MAEPPYSRSDDNRWYWDGEEWCRASESDETRPPGDPPSEINWVTRQPHEDPVSSSVPISSKKIVDCLFPIEKQVLGKRVVRGYRLDLRGISSNMTKQYGVRSAVHFQMVKVYIGLLALLVLPFVITVASASTRTLNNAIIVVECFLALLILLHGSLAFVDGRKFKSSNGGRTF